MNNTCISLLIIIITLLFFSANDKQFEYVEKFMSLFTKEVIELKSQKKGLSSVSFTNDSGGGADGYAVGLQVFIYC